MWDQHIMTADYVMIPKGEEDRRGNRLIAWMMSADHAAEITKYIDYGPANDRCHPEGGPAVAEHVPTAHLDAAFATTTCGGPTTTTSSTQTGRATSRG